MFEFEYWDPKIFACPNFLGIHAPKQIAATEIICLGISCLQILPIFNAATKSVVVFVYWMSQRCYQAICWFFCSACCSDASQEGRKIFTSGAWTHLHMCACSSTHGMGADLFFSLFTRSPVIAAAMHIVEYIPNLQAFWSFWFTHQLKFWKDREIIIQISHDLQRRTKNVTLFLT